MPPDFHPTAATDSNAKISLQCLKFRYTEFLSFLAEKNPRIVILRNTDNHVAPTDFHLTKAVISLLNRMNYIMKFIQFFSHSDVCKVVGATLIRVM